MNRPAEANYFRDYLSRTGDKLVIKMDHYLDIYPRILRGWGGRNINFLEIGVYKGGSLDLWKGFFGPEARLNFIDIDPACKALEIPGTHIEIGDQSDAAFLSNLATRHGPFDLIVDDGGHKMNQQLISFQTLWPRLADGGIYVVEDTHTSYWPGFGGGIRAPGSFIEFAKDLVDRMHSWYTDQDVIFPFDPLAKEIGAVNFYDSMVVIEKQLKQAPVSLSSRNGQIGRSSKILEVRGRVSIF
jgi:hypothetical protein